MSKNYLTMRKISRKAACTIILCFFIITFAVSCSNKTAGDVYTVRLVIDCSSALSFEGMKEEKRDVLPNSGIIADEQVRFHDGETAEKLIVSLLRAEKKQFDCDGGYFSGICNLYEGDCGAFSGWMLYVNGTLSDVGASEYTVNENDVISLVYVTDYRSLFDDAA